MRLILAALVLAATLLGADRAAAQLHCEPPAADLGELRGGKPVSRRFELVNDGKAPIELLDVERGCGCLETTLEKRTLGPGERTGVVVRLRTAGQPEGPRAWNLRVRYREGGNVRETLLVLGATIHNDVTVQPSILALCVRDVLRQEIVVTDRRTPPLRVTALHTSAPALRAVVQSRDGGVTRIVLEVSAAALGGGREDAVLDIYTDDPVYSPLSVPVALSRAATPAVAATPPRVEFRPTAAQPVASALVRLRPADGQKVVVASADADDPGVTCRWAAGPGDGVTLRVEVDARRLAPRATPREVRVRLSAPSPQVLTIPVVVSGE